ncbi:hypothetical protein QL996_15270 [Planococcus sp. APC 4015]|nr:hypothetical protein [Planococcus sp. APC 4015]
MNDELTPREHDAMRERVLAGVHRIKPVGAHRMQLIAASIALVLVGGLAGGAIAAGALFGSAELPPVDSPTPMVSATPTASPTPTPTPTPTEEPVEPAIVLGGDCTALLSADAAMDILGPDAVAAAPGGSAFSGYSDLSASASLLGALRCGWSSPNADSRIEVGVYPIDSIAQSVREDFESPRCFLTRYCDMGRQIGEFWVATAVRPPTSMDLGEQHRIDAEAMATRTYEQIAPNLVGATAVGVPRESTWWTLPDCGVLTVAVESVTGGPLDPVYPGDAIPEGAEWDAIVSAGLNQWCPWNGTGTALLMVETFAQPGVGTPTADEVRDGTPIDIDGADSAWFIASQSFDNDFTIVAVSGPNRLLVRYRDETRSDFDVSNAAGLTEAVLAQLR